MTIRGVYHVADRSLAKCLAHGPSRVVRFARYESPRTNYVQLLLAYIDLLVLIE